MCYCCILRLINLTSNWCSEFSSTVTIDFQFADTKLESSEAYLPKLEKNLSFSKGFEIIDIFCKNAVLNICRYLKRFYTYKKINSIFLKIDHSLLRMPKLMEIG